MNEATFLSSCIILQQRRRHYLRGRFVRMIPRETLRRSAPLSIICPHSLFVSSPLLLLPERGTREGGHLLCPLVFGIVRFGRSFRPDTLNY